MPWVNSRRTVLRLVICTSRMARVKARIEQVQDRMLDAADILSTGIQ
jgi:hypothetical protein